MAKILGRFVVIRGARVLEVFSGSRNLPQIHVISDSGRLHLGDIGWDGGCSGLLLSVEFSQDRLKLSSGVNAVVVGPRMLLENLFHELDSFRHRLDLI